MASRRMNRESNGPSNRTIRYPDGGVDIPLKKSRMARETTPANEQYRMRKLPAPIGGEMKETIKATQNAKQRMNSIRLKESNRVSGGEMMKATQAAKNVNALRQQGYSAKEAARKTNRNILHEAFSEANSISKLKDKIKKR